MKNKIISELEQYNSEDSIQNRQIKFNSYKAKQALKEQRKKLQLRLFGEHFNYSKVGLNKEKKYLIEEQRNTEIERSNRILLEKIQRIAKRSTIFEERKKTMTDHSQENIQSYQTSSLKPQKIKAASKSVHHLAKDKLTFDLSARFTQKILFQGIFTHNNIQIPIKTLIENNRFTITADLGKIKQQIHTTIDSYRTFFRETLEAEHSKIVDYLTFNGQLLEFKGVNKQKVSIQEQQQFSLPSIDKKLRLKTTAAQEEILHLE